MWVVRSNNTSTAPFVYTTSDCSSSIPRYLVLINLRSESKGISSKRCIVLRSCFVSVKFCANTSKQDSVGSPSCFPSVNTASLFKTALYKNAFCTKESPVSSCGSTQCLSRYNFVTVILFCVKVPVLSEHITETQPRLSTADNFLMIAPCTAIFCVPIA